MNLSLHTRRRIAAFLVVVMVVSTFVGVSPTTVGASNDDVVELKILHTNDLHSYIEDFGRMAAYLEQERTSAEYSLYLDGGDIFSGNPINDFQDGRPIIDLLNHMSLDALAFGNHEFDYGPEAFMARQNESQFPWLGANVELVDPTQTVIEQPDDYHIFELGDGEEKLTVGVVGLTQAPPSTSPVGVVGLDFHDPVEKAKEYEFLRGQVDVLIALTHIGHEADERIAEEAGFYDLIVGGHSHRAYTARMVNGTPMVQAGSYASHIGNLTLEVNRTTGEVTLKNSTLQNVSQLTEVNEEIDRKVDEYFKEVEEEIMEVIGTSNTGLTRDGRFTGDAPLGNFYTDSMRHLSGADIALANNGGIRSSIPSGEITVFDIHMLEPFRNQMMLFEMTGQAIKDVIEYSYSRRNQIDLQSSGLHYTVVTNPTGGYYDSELYVNGEPLDLEETYTVAVGDYIGTGGSGYHFEGTVIEETAGLLTEAMIEYAKYMTDEGQAIDYTREGRITTRVDESAPPSGNVIGSTENGLASANLRQSDVGIGNLYTDGIRFDTEADIGLINASSIRGEIPAGLITDEMIENLDQYKNDVVVVDASGQDIRDTLLSQANFHRGVDLQASGIHYTLIEADEGNARFSDIEITMADGSTFDINETYKVAYNDYMHAQPFYNLGEAREGDYGKVWEATVRFVEQYDGPIDYVEGDRISIQEVEVDLPDGVISVAEAIANNSGEGTVGGYVIGHTVSTNNYNFEPPFSNNFNFIMADSPDERDPSKFLLVQVTSDFRSEFGLQSNPDLIGQKVHVTGSLEAYFTRPGLRSPSHMEIVEDTALSIADVRAMGVGHEVTFEGIVTSNPGAWGSQGFYVQDETAGLYVFQNEYEVQLGDVVKISGTTDQFNGEFQVSSLTSLDFVGQMDVPQPVVVSPSDISSANEGQLVKLEQVTIENLRQVNNFGTFEFEAVQGEESVLIRVDNRTGVDYNNFAYTNGDVLDIVGLSSQFRGTIQMKPRMADDFVYIDVTPPITTITVEGEQLHFGAYIEEVIVELQATDNHSGVKDTYYSLDNGETWNVYEGRFSIPSSDHVENVHYYSVDETGNEEEIQAYSLTIVSAHIDTAQTLLEEATINPYGTKRSLMAQLDVAQHHFNQAEKARERGHSARAVHHERLGYDRLQHVIERINRFSDRFDNEYYALDLIQLIEYIIEHDSMSVARFEMYHHFYRAA